MKENIVDVKGLYKTVLYLFYTERQIIKKKLKELEISKSINM